MLNADVLRRVKLLARPYGQLLVKQFMKVDYRFPRLTEVVIEGKERFPHRPVFLAMNHTDRYNYWPLQYALSQAGLGFTATWVKGKYYENKWIGRFLSAMNNIPVPSRGYLITSEFRQALGRPPNGDEYRVVRDLVDGVFELRAMPEGTGPDIVRFVGDTEDKRARFVEGFVERFAAMAREVVRLNQLALEELGLHVLVFPEGTRSKRLQQGHVGLAQMTQHLGATIIPVGCNGSDQLYPGNSPFSKGGRVVYRIGEPISPEDTTIADYRVPSDVLPFTAAAQTHAASYRAITDVVMARIADLLDDPYRPSGIVEKRQDSGRFL